MCLGIFWQFSTSPLVESRNLGFFYVFDRFR